MKSEAQIQREIMLALSQQGVTVWRNNTAFGWQGDEVIKRGRDVILKNARPVRCGLCVGSADLIGIKPMVIEKNDVGRTVGLFYACEVKTGKGVVSDEQWTFINHVNDRGGEGVVARSVEDL